MTATLKAMILPALAGTLCLPPLAAPAAAAGRAGQVIYQTAFDGAGALAGWAGDGRLEASFTQGVTLAVEQRDGPAAGGAAATCSLPCQEARGCLVLVSALVKNEAVTEGPHAVKLMATVAAPSGNETYQAGIGGGTVNWRQAAVRVFVPRDATQITLTLGLDAGSLGKVWFDDVKVTIRQVNAVVTGKLPPAATRFSRLRGAMIDPTSFKAVEAQVLGGQWNANVVRWQMINAPPAGGPLSWTAYDQWLEKEIQRLDAMLPVLDRLGMAVVVDLHCPPGSIFWEATTLLTEPERQDKLIAVWRKLAGHYRGTRNVFGYDLVNEPIDLASPNMAGYDTVPGDARNWWELADKTARAIREVDPKTAIIFEPSPGGIPYGWKNLHPLTVANVVYSLHMYYPYQFSHQLVLADFPTPLRYPGFEFAGEVWDLARVKREIQPVIDFQQKYGARIYVGEFSATRWAADNSAYRYIKDLTDIFEANGWDWCYHAFRENPCWSVELDEDKDHPTAKVTERQKLLRHWFAKNRRPAW